MLASSVTGKTKVALRSHWLAVIYGVAGVVVWSVFFCDSRLSASMTGYADDVCRGQKRRSIAYKKIQEQRTLQVAIWAIW
jgi:hypothetical protein